MNKVVMQLAALSLAAFLQACGGGAAISTSAPVDGTTFSDNSGSADVAPTITYTGFAVVQDGKSYSAKVVVFFSEDMDPASINTKSFLVFDTAGKKVAGTIDYLGVTAVLTPIDRFDANTTYSARITTGVRSMGGVSLAKERDWTFKTPDPSELTGVLVTVSSTLPDRYAMNVALNSGVNVTFNQVMDPATVNTSTVRVLDPSGNAVPGAVHYTGVTASFVPSVPFAPNTTYRATVSAAAKSLGGVSMDQDYRWDFTTGTDLGAAAPQVVMTSPMDGDSAVGLTDSLAVYFNEAMDTSSVNSSNIALFDAGGNQLDGTVTYSGTVAVFKPAAPLAPLTQYTLRVAAAVSSAGGAQMGSDYFASFTTGTFSASSSIAPAVAFADPAPNAYNVATSAKLSIAFNVQLDPSTVSGTTVTVTAPDGSAVAGSVSCEGSNVYFVPAQPLASGVSYTVTVAGIKSIDGVAMQAPDSWIFTTAMAF